MDVQSRLHDTTQPTALHERAARAGRALGLALNGATEQKVDAQISGADLVVLEAEHHSLRTAQDAA